MFLFINVLEYYPFSQLESRTEATFQQNDASLHIGNVLSLNTQFPNKRLSSGGPISWSTPSHDLILLDLFFGGYIKDKVCSSKVTSMQQLKGRISRGSGHSAEGDS
jgi:hypothetical protein